MSHHDNPTSLLLAIPPEIRNTIYDLIYTTPSPYRPLPRTPKSSSRVSLSTFGRISPLDELSAEASNRHLCGLLQSCRQLHAEAHLLFLSRISFHLSGPYATPEYFDRITAPLSTDQVKHIKNITLTGRINNLRAMNESWDGLPFKNPNLHLRTLTIVPRRPYNHETQYAEIADLSQSHTLAYILAETLKSLKGIERIIVRNDQECFNHVVWRLVYRSLVYRLWRWGGANLDLRFRQDTSGQGAWFEVLIAGDAQDIDGWATALTEVQRLTGLEEAVTNA